MAVTLRFKLFDQDCEKAVNFTGSKTEVIDHCTKGIQAAVFATAKDFLLMFRDRMTATFERVQGMAGGNLLPFTVEFDNGDVEECVADISAEAIRSTVWNSYPESEKELVREHVKDCDNPECPVSDVFSGGLPD